MSWLVIGIFVFWLITMIWVLRLFQLAKKVDEQTDKWGKEKRREIR